MKLSKKKFYTKNKFGAKRCSGGFPSKLEKSVYDILLTQEKLGIICEIKRQDCVSLTRADIRCKIDFSYVNTKSGDKRYVEAKGFETDRWKIIKKLWKYYGSGALEIYKGTYKKIFLDETIIPK